MKQKKFVKLMSKAFCLILVLSACTVILSSCFNVLESLDVFDIQQNTKNIPDEYAQHVFLRSKNNGGCRELLGDITLTVVYVDDDDSLWDDASLTEHKTRTNEALDKLCKNASEYGQTLNTDVEYATAKVEGKGRIEDDEAFAAAALESASLPENFCLNNDLEDSYGVDEAPVIFCVNKDGRSYAIQDIDSEYVILYNDGITDTIVHELLHLFGAQDYYIPETVKTLATELFPESIMNDEEGEVDELTAYLIGWTKQPSEKSAEFLKKTEDITAKELEDASEEDGFTGYAENHRKGDCIYTGDMDYGVFHGHGIAVWDDGATYDGEWKHNEKDGKGTYTTADGYTYTGTWVHDLQNGEGTATWSNGASYTGSWKDGEIDGYGTFVFDTGDTYSGELSVGQKCGQGTYTTNDGYKYFGQWSNDSRNGEGTAVWPDGASYTGSWANDLMNGKGTYIYAEGQKYVGEWKDGKFHGYGTLYLEDGTIYQQGTFENNEFIG